MTDQDNHRETEDGNRKTPAEGSVVDTRDLGPSETVPEGEGGPGADALPVIESSLLGEGGHPAATPADRDTATDGSEGPADSAAPNGFDTLAGESALGRPMHEVPDLSDSDGPVLPGVIVPPTGGRVEPDPQLASSTMAGDTPPPSRPVQRRRSGFWPMVLGGVVAAGLGGGAVWLAGADGMEGPVEAPTTLSPEAETAARAAAADAARFEINSQSQALLDAARQAGTEAAEEAIAAQPQDDSAAPDPSALEDMGKRIAALEARVQDIAKQPAPAPQPADTPPAPPADMASAETLSQVQSRLQQLASQVEDLSARPTLDSQAVQNLRDLASQAESTRQSITETADQVQQRLQKAQGQTDDLTQRLDQTTQRVDNAAAVAALQSALVNGSEAQSAVTQLRDAGVQPPQALTVPVPALTTLQHDFPDAARTGLRAALKVGGDEGAGSGLVNFLRAQTGARSVTPQSGSDPDAVLSRAGAAVDKGDIDVALTEIASLPPAAQTAMQDWTTAAKAWVDARTALGTLKTTP